MAGIGTENLRRAEESRLNRPHTDPPPHGNNDSQANLENDRADLGRSATNPTEIYPDRNKARAPQAPGVRPDAPQVAKPKKGLWTGRSTGYKAAMVLLPAATVSTLLIIAGIEAGIHGEQWGVEHNFQPEVFSEPDTSVNNNGTSGTLPI